MLATPDRYSNYQRFLTFKDYRFINIFSPSCTLKVALPILFSSIGTFFRPVRIFLCPANIPISRHITLQQVMTNDQFTPQGGCLSCYAFNFVIITELYVVLFKIQLWLSKNYQNLRISVQFFFSCVGHHSLLLFCKRKGGVRVRCILRASTDNI